MFKNISKLRTFIIYIIIIQNIIGGWGIHYPTSNFVHFVRPLRILQTTKAKSRSSAVGLNPVTQWDTPKWQKAIASFFNEHIL